MDSGPGKSDGQSRPERLSSGPGAPRGDSALSPDAHNRAHATSSFIVVPKPPSLQRLPRAGEDDRHAPQSPEIFPAAGRQIVVSPPQWTHWSSSGGPAERAETQTRRRPCGPRLSSSGFGRTPPIDPPSPAQKIQKARPRFGDEPLWMGLGGHVDQGAQLTCASLGPQP
jgi:hypothetical protein